MDKVAPVSVGEKRSRFSPSSKLSSLAGLIVLVLGFALLALHGGAASTVEPSGARTVLDAAVEEVHEPRWGSLVVRGGSAVGSTNGWTDAKLACEELSATLGELYPTSSVRVSMASASGPAWVGEGSSVCSSEGPTSFFMGGSLKFGEHEWHDAGLWVGLWLLILSLVLLRPRFIAALTPVRSGGSDGEVEGSLTSPLPDRTRLVLLALASAVLLSGAGTYWASSLLLRPDDASVSCGDAVVPDGYSLESSSGGLYSSATIPADADPCEALPTSD